jgi:hypothetical protein
MYGFWVPLWYLVAIGVLRIRTSKDRQHNGHKIPNGYSESVHQRTDNTMATRYQMGTQNPYIMSFDVRILSTNLVSCGHCVVCPLIYGFWVPLWYLVAIVLSVLWCTDSEYPLGTQNPYMKGQTTQWPQDTKWVLRIRTSKDRQHNGHKIPNGYSESVHQRTWVPIWYLVAIVLSVLWCTDSEYPFGILWPLCCLSFGVRILSTPLVSKGY